MFKSIDHKGVHARRMVARFVLPAVLVGALGVVADSNARAAETDYYKGKTFTVMVATRPGGGTDTVGRLVARFWSDHIPGNPDILVRNKPLQVIGANDLHNRVRPDGLTVGVFAGGGSLGPVARHSKSVRYDPTKWGFVGSIERGPSILLIRESALPRLRDPKAEPVAMGSVNTDRPQDAMAIFGMEYMGWNLKFVLGYPNSNSFYLAYGRGEIDMFGSGTTKIIERFIKDEGAVPLAAEVDRPDMPKVPTFEKLMGDNKPKGVKWDAYRAWAGPSSVDKYFAVSPGTPKALLNILRASFQATTQDPEFVKQARNILGGGYVVLDGPATRALVEGAIVIPEGALKEITALRVKYGLPKISRKAAKLVKVTFDEVQREGRVLKFKVEGKKMKLRVSGSRTEVMIGGKISPRSGLKTGMTCEVSWAKRGSRIEARKVICP